MVDALRFPLAEKGDPGEIVPVWYGPRPEIYGTLKALQQGYMPRRGRVVYVSPHGWQTLELLDRRGRALYRESFFVGRDEA